MTYSDALVRSTDRMTVQPITLDYEILRAGSTTPINPDPITFL
jgi:hypothetical protein